MVAALAIEALLLLALLSLGRTSGLSPAPQVTEISLTAHDAAAPAPESPEPETVPPEPSQPVKPQPVDAAVPVPPQPMPPPAAVISLPTAPPAPPPVERPAPPVPNEPVYGPPDTVGPRADDSERVGTAPNGEPLYAAQWYRKPGKDFEGFLSAASPGYGLMACRTIPNFYVTDCVPLAETPGSMLNRSMLAGSGVLRVRPPRLGGRSLVGAWVRIRVDYTIHRK